MAQSTSKALTTVNTLRVYTKICLHHDARSAFRPLLHQHLIRLNQRRSRNGRRIPFTVRTTGPIARNSGRTHALCNTSWSRRKIVCKRP
eukprot:4808527-Prymnesium_polylepis.1